MISEKIENSYEAEHPAALNCPAVESFADLEMAKKVWPENVVENGDFLKQIKERQELNKNLDEVVDSLPRPDISLEEAIKQRMINEAQVERLYNSLSDLLEKKDYERAALYLPFEFLPSKSWQPESEGLKAAKDRFVQAYLKDWHDLLFIQDVRANFVDGDVLEIEQRESDLPRVVKAAHLAPELVKKGLLEVDEIIELMAQSKDDILKNSLADALMVMADMGLVDARELESMRSSADGLVIGVANIIAINSNEEEKEVALEPVTYSSIHSWLDEKISNFKKEELEGATEKRKKWLEDKNVKEAIEGAGLKISSAIIREELSENEAQNFLGNEINSRDRQAIIEGVRMAIEDLTKKNSPTTQNIYQRYEKYLSQLWEKDEPETKRVLIKIYRHLNKLEIVSDDYLAGLGISLPKLEGPFSDNLALIEKDILRIREAAIEAGNDPELSNLVYPVALVYGSRLKGYGNDNTDNDIGVFAKPNVSLEEKEKVKKLLEGKFNKEKTGGEAALFWLEEKGENLQLRQLNDESFWTQVFFNAAWEGNGEAILELRKKFLTPFLIDKGEDEKRKFLLEEMEHDDLQYRLMHEGYERFYPAYGGIKTPHAKSIDSQSAFYDSGYRQLATKLFASRVFLPKIEIKK